MLVLVVSVESIFIGKSSQVSFVAILSFTIIVVRTNLTVHSQLPCDLRLQKMILKVHSKL